MKVNQDILSIYEEILINNKNILSELELVKLNNTNYSNLKYDNDGTQSDSVNKPLLDDIDAAAKAAGLTATVTTASTGHSIKTKTGNTSRHGQQTAVDIAILNGIGAGGATNSADGNSEFRSLGNKLAKALVSMGYTLNTESGNSKAVLWQTDTGGNHYNHLHVSNNSGESGTTPTSDSNASDKAYADATKTDATPKSTSPFNASGVEKDSFLTDVAKGLTSKFVKTESIQEQKKFGKDISNRYGRIIIPKDSNPKIKSPISGVIYNKRYSSSCANQITILNTDNQKIYIQFCGISSPKVRDGQSISVGDTLGMTDSDVEVTMYDSSWGIIPIGSEGVDKYTEKKKDDKEKSKKKDDTNKYYTDPLTAIAAGVPAKILDKIFGDKYDEKTGEITQKRWGGVADRQPVDPWLLDLIKSPFKSKKVNENIERIKKLL